MAAADQTGPERVEALRRAFDESFEAPALEARDAGESLVAIRVAGQPFAVRRSQLLAVHRRPWVVPLAGGPPDLLGIAAVRGNLVAVYDLAWQLGSQAAAAESGWILLANRGAPVALAFESFEGQVQVERGDCFESREGAARDGAPQLARAANGLRTVIDLAAVIEAIRRRAESKSEAT